MSTMLIAYNSVHEVDLKLQKILPIGYKYKIIEFQGFDGGHFSALFRINIFTKEEADHWLQLHQDLSLVTWRVAVSNKAAGRHVISKTRYRCQHNTDPRGHNSMKRTSKHANCAATLRVSIKRLLTHRKQRSNDVYLTEYPTVVCLNHRHTHDLITPAALRHRIVTGQSLISVGPPLTALPPVTSPVPPPGAEQILYDSVGVDGGFVLDGVFYGGDIAALYGYQVMTDCEVVEPAYDDGEGMEAEGEGVGNEVEIYGVRAGEEGAAVDVGSAEVPDERMRERTMARMRHFFDRIDAVYRCDPAAYQPCLDRFIDGAERLTTDALIQTLSSTFGIAPLPARPRRSPPASRLQRLIAESPPLGRIPRDAGTRRRQGRIRRMPLPVVARVSAAPEHCYAAKAEVMEECFPGEELEQQWVTEEEGLVVGQAELSLATATINGVLSAW